MKRAALLLVATGCGSEAVAPDATPPDAPHFAFPTCPIDYDGVYLAELSEFLPVGEGRDLDGDGDVDNALGVLGPVVNPVVAESIANGATSMFVLPGLVIPPPAEPVEMEAFLPDATDVDGDPSNNFDDGEFLIALEQFDASCSPRLPLHVTQTGTTLSGAAERLELITAEGAAEARGVLFDATITEDGTRLDAVTSGAFTICALDRISFPGDTPGSVLGGLVSFGMQPDIDHDGDGYERIELEENAVARCVDGDGTVIDGLTCTCDPRMIDGYSVAIHVEAVPARIVGSE